MTWLRNSRYPVLPLAEAVQRLDDGSLPDHAVVITIDDGWSSTYTHMLPVLEGLGLPATVYVTTWYADHQIPVVNVALDYIMRRAGRSPSDRSAITAEIVKLPSLAQREQALRACAARFGVTTEEWWESRQFHLMSAAEIGAAESARPGHPIAHPSPPLVRCGLRPSRTRDRRQPGGIGQSVRPAGAELSTFLLSQRAGPFLRGCGSRSGRGRFGDPGRERDKPAGRQSLSAAPVSRWPSGVRGRVRGLFERRPGAVPHRQKSGDRGKLTQNRRTKPRPRRRIPIKVRPFRDSVAPLRGQVTLTPAGEVRQTYWRRQGGRELAPAGRTRPVVCVKFCKSTLVMLGVGGAEPPCSAAPPTPGRRQAAKARRASFLCSFRCSMLR